MAKQMAKPETKFPDKTADVDVRVLVDFEGLRINTVAAVSKSRADELASIGVVDSSPAAVAYARSIEKTA